jgi:hypothetical protein
MPQLLSRMDDLNWLTPAIADILNQGAAPPGGGGLIREQMLTLQRRLGELETPVRVINVLPTPSHTIFVARPEFVGRLGNRRQVTANEIRRSLSQISEEQQDWKLGFMPQVQGGGETFGILLRTNEHKPLSLRRLLVHSPFRDHPSNLALAIGATLEQRLIVHDLEQSGSLLVIGADAAKTHLIHSLMLTLITINTPGELRLAVAGTSSETFKALTQTPHALGRLLTRPDEGQRLLEGLSREITRRRERFEEAQVSSIAGYNALLREGHKTILPRIVVLIDTLSDEDWQEARDAWIPYLSELLEDSGKSGIHLILAVNEANPPDLPSVIDQLVPVRLVLRSAASEIADNMKSFHKSMLRFIDVFFVDSQGGVAPVEICAIALEEIQRTVSYWQQAAQQRRQESQTTEVSGRTGVTGFLSPTPAEAAAEPATATPGEGRLPFADPVGATRIQRAQALAAYLGWIGAGPLQDVLGFSAADAQQIIAEFKASGVVENNDSPTPRFIVFTEDAQTE